MAENHDQLLTARQLSRRLGVHILTVRKWTREGKLPCLQVGGVRRYAWSAILDLAKEPQEQGSNDAE